MIRAVAAAVMATGAALLRWRPRRFEVVEESMSPALRHGDYIVTMARRGYRHGDVVVFTHPRQPGFVLIKRIAAPPEPLATGMLWVLGDNTTASTSDSRLLGPISRDLVIGRAFFRYHPVRRIGRITGSSTPT